MPRSLQHLPPMTLLTRYVRLLLLCAASSLAMRVAMAQVAPSPAAPDILVLSDTLTYDDVKRVSVFTGNVLLTRGAMTLSAHTLRLREDEAGNQFATATARKGELVSVRQENPQTFEVIEARGLRAEYSSQSEEIEMIGQAVVTRMICGKPFDTISGARVIYRQKTDTYEAHGGADSAGPGGRVRSLAQPRARINAAIAACRQAQAR